MLVFVIKSDILHYIEDYINHVRWYLDEKFGIDSELLCYNDPVPIAEKYTDIIFVQRINPHMLPRRLQILAPVKNVRQSFAARNFNFPSSIGQPDKPQPVHEPIHEQVRRVFLLNTEQATVASYLRATLSDIKQYKPYVIDYSLENIEILRFNAPQTVFIHFPYPPRVKDPSLKSIAIVSLLSSAHRRSVCDDLGISVTNFSGLWKNNRDILIQKSLLLLNLHFNPRDYTIFESIRCYGALEQGTLVISEPCYRKDLVLLKDYIIFVPLDKLAETVQDVLQNYKEYYNMMFNEASIVRMEKLIEKTYTESVDKMLELGCKPQDLRGIPKIYSSKSFE